MENPIAYIHHLANPCVAHSRASGTKPGWFTPIREFSNGGEPMRIVQIAPPWFTIPPCGYGGIERVVYDLVEGETAAGCEVILCAPAGSETSARLVPNVPRLLGLDMTEAEKIR